MASEPRVLVVDDDAGVTKLIETALRMHGYEVRIEHNSAAALDTALAFRPDILILDIMMPARSGGDVAEDIRTQSDTRELPIIFLSGTLDEAEANAASQGSINELFVQKPVEIPQLLEAIRKCLNREAGSEVPDRAENLQSLADMQETDQT